MPACVWPDLNADIKLTWPADTRMTSDISPIFQYKRTLTLLEWALTSTACMPDHIQLIICIPEKTNKTATVYVRTVCQTKNWWIFLNEMVKRSGFRGVLLSGIEAVGFFCTVNCLRNLAGFITFALDGFKEVMESSCWRLFVSGTKSDVCVSEWFCSRRFCFMCEAFSVPYMFLTHALI